MLRLLCSCILGGALLVVAHEKEVVSVDASAQARVEQRPLQPDDLHPDYEHKVVVRRPDDVHTNPSQVERKVVRSVVRAVMGVERAQVAFDGPSNHDDDGETAPILSSLNGAAIDDAFMGPQSEYLLNLAASEEKLKGVSWHANPAMIMWPRSTVTLVSEMRGEKLKRYLFVGSAWAARHQKGHRKWAFDFAKKHFETGRDLYVDTDCTSPGCEIGPFDSSYSYNKLKHGGFGYDRKYFQAMASAKLCLCPAGNQPWSFRFVEAIFARCIPVVESVEHASSERHAFGTPLVMTPKIGGWKFYTYNSTTNPEAWTYREDWAEENLRKALQHHTLMQEHGYSIDHPALVTKP